MQVANLVLPVFAVIVTGWLGYIPRSLADGLVHFAYNVAMPALLFITMAQEPALNLLEWRFRYGVRRRVPPIASRGDAISPAVRCKEWQRR